MLYLYVPGFQVFKHDKTLSERSKKVKEQKKNEGSVLVAESAYNSQNAQFGLVMVKFDVISQRSFHLSILYLNASDSYLPYLSTEILHVLRKNFFMFKLYHIMQSLKNNWFSARSLIFQYFF